MRRRRRWPMPSSRSFRIRRRIARPGKASDKSRWHLAVAVLPDGRRAVSVSYDSTVKVWNLERWEEERTLPAPDHPAERSLTLHSHKMCEYSFAEGTMVEGNPLIFP